MTIQVNSETTIVFDLDDTLYKEIEFLKSAYGEIAETIDEKNWKSTYALMFALYREGKDVFKYLSNEFKVDTEQLIGIYRAHKPRISLSENTVILLNQLKNAGASLTLLTDGRTRTQKNKISALGLEHWMDLFFISEELGSEKPDQRNFKAVEDHFKSSTYFYIADNLKKDFIAPNILGWESIGLIDNGQNIHFSSISYQEVSNRPKHFVLDLSEIKVNELG